FFFFQAEDGIRDFHVTGVQTCALPIYELARSARVVLDDELDVAGHGDLGALRAAGELGAQLLQLDVEVARDVRQDVAVRTGGGDLERGHGLALRLDLDDLARLHAEGRTVDELAVDEDVAVHDGLAGLGDRTGEAGAQDEGVQTHLEQLDERLTGQAGLLAGLLEDARHLGLAQTVLRAQTLLLLKADGVVGLGAATGAAVLTGAVRALLEVLDRLGGQRDAEGAGEAHLTARPSLVVLAHCVVLPVVVTSRDRTDVRRAGPTMTARAPGGCPKATGQ